MDAEIYDPRSCILLEVGAIQTPVSADCQLIWSLYSRFCWRIWSFLHFNPIASKKKSRINHWQDHTDTKSTQIKSHHATLKTNSVDERAGGPSFLKHAQFCRSHVMFSLEKLPCESYRDPASGSRAGYGDEKPRDHFSREDRASAISLWPLMCLLQTGTLTRTQIQVSRFLLFWSLYITSLLWN